MGCICQFVTENNLVITSHVLKTGYLNMFLINQFHLRMGLLCITENIKDNFPPIIAFGLSRKGHSIKHQRVWSVHYAHRVKDMKIKSLEERDLSLCSAHQRIWDHRLFLGASFKDQSMKMMPVQKQNLLVGGPCSRHLSPLGITKDTLVLVPNALSWYPLPPMGPSFWPSSPSSRCSVKAPGGQDWQATYHPLQSAFPLWLHAGVPLPCPRATGIVSAPVLRSYCWCGIDDCYTSTRGCTAKLGNSPEATFDAISKSTPISLLVSGEMVFSKSASQEFTKHLVSTHMRTSVQRA